MVVTQVELGHTARSPVDPELGRGGRRPDVRFSGILAELRINRLGGNLSSDETPVGVQQWMPWVESARHTRGIERLPTESVPDVRRRLTSRPEQNARELVPIHQLVRPNGDRGCDVAQGIRG